MGDDFVNYINNSYDVIYDSNYPINALGTKSVLVKINNICFAIFDKDADGAYNDTIVGATTLPSIMLKCGNGFTIYERTEGSKLAMSIMDDGRVDLNNIGTDSIVIPQFTDSSLDDGKLSKYNFMYFEVNLFNHNTISRNDYGFMVSRPNFNFWKETSLNYYNASVFGMIIHKMYLLFMLILIDWHILKIENTCHVIYNNYTLKNLTINAIDWYILQILIIILIIWIMIME